MSTERRPLPISGFAIGLNDGTLALFGAAVLLYSAVLWTAHARNVETTDFSLVYIGAKIIHDGMGPDLYRITLQQQLRGSLFEHPVPLFFEHPPFEALLLSPLARYAFRSAYLVWGFTNVTVWLGLMIFLRGYLPWPREDLGYTFMWLLFAPLWVALYQGQSSLLVLAAYALTFVLLKKEEDFTAGAMLGFGLLKFQFVLPFVMIFLIRKKWRFAGGFATTGLVLSVLSVAAVGWKGVAAYIRFLLAIGNNPQNISYGSGVDMPTIHGLVFAILGQRINTAELNIVVALLSVALLLWVALRWEKQEQRASFDLMFAAAVSVSLLSGSHMFTHDFGPLVLSMLLAAACVARNQISLGLKIGVMIALALFWMFPLYFVLVKLHSLYLMSSVLLLFTWAAMKSAQEGRSSSELQAVATH